MGKQQRRRSISIRSKVYDRLMYHIASSDHALGLAGSNVTEDALTKYLDAAGVPEKVPPHVRPSDTKPKPERKADEGPDRPAHFTF